MSEGGSDIEEEIRQAIHMIVVRLLPPAQKQFLVFAGQLGLLSLAEVDLLIGELGLRNF